MAWPRSSLGSTLQQLGRRAGTHQHDLIFQHPRKRKQDISTSNSKWSHRTISCRIYRILSTLEPTKIVETTTATLLNIHRLYQAHNNVVMLSMYRSIRILVIVILVRKKEFPVKCSFLISHILDFTRAANILRFFTRVMSHEDFTWHAPHSNNRMLFECYVKC